MELVVVAVFGFSCLVVVALGAYLAIRSLSIALGEAHRKLMARDLQELANSAATERWAKSYSEESPSKTQGAAEAAAFDPMASWYGEGWRFPS